MLLNRNYLYCCLVLVLFTWNTAQECPPADTTAVNAAQDSWDIPSQNDWTEFEIMTWNLKAFPIAGGNTIDYVNEIITDLLPDVIAFQEVSNASDYNSLAAGLPAYSFIHSGSSLALAVRMDVVQIDNYSTLFPNDGYDLAWRYPLRAQISWVCGLSAKTMQVINVHLKSGGETDDYQRRYNASVLLADYIQNHPGDNIIVLGDYNDEIDDPESSNSLWPLVSSDDAYFTTTPISGIEYYFSYPNWPSFIDHILVSTPLFDEESMGSTTTTLRLDDYVGYSFYQNNISDHRPVIWSFPMEEVGIPEGLVINEIMQNPSAVSGGFGEWIELINIGDQNINLNGLVLSDEDSDHHVINSPGGLIIAPGEFLVLGINDDISVNGGIEVDYRYSDFFLSNNWDEVIITHPSGILVDEVYFDNGITFPDPSGASMSLIDVNTDNDDGQNWSISSMLMTSGDYGTPGAPNTLNNDCVSAGNGDVNTDGELNVLDIVAIVQYVLNWDDTGFSAEQICAADRNGDDLINILDIVVLVDDILNI